MFALIFLKRNDLNCELPDVQAGFRKSRGTRDQIANICWVIEKTREFWKNFFLPVLPKLWKRSVFIPIPKKGNAKECSNYLTIALISYTSKVILKILQARIQQYMNCKLPYVQVGFKKAEEPEIKLPTSDGSSKKQESLLIIILMQIKTTMRYHLAPVRMATIKKSTNSKCWRGCGAKGMLLHC